MMDAPPPLLAHHPPPCRGLPLQKDDGTVGAKNVAVSSTTMDKFGIFARVMVSTGAMTNAMDIVAWRQSP
jgi:hypothetical protein